MKKIANNQTKVPETHAMNDRDYLNDILASEKDLSTNMAIFLNEASNDKLYKELMPMFNRIKDKQRKLYELAFQNGWYTLEEADKKQVKQKHQELAKLYQEFSK